MKERITVRMTSEMITRIDAWIARQPGYVSRQDAIRHCVDLVLGQPTPEEASRQPLEANSQYKAGTDNVD